MSAGERREGKAGGKNGCMAGCAVGCLICLAFNILVPVFLFGLGLVGGIVGELFDDPDDFWAYRGGYFLQRTPLVYPYQLTTCDESTWAQMDLWWKRGERESPFGVFSVRGIRLIDSTGDYAFGRCEEWGEANAPTLFPRGRGPLLYPLGYDNFILNYRTGEVNVYWDEDEFRAACSNLNLAVDTLMTPQQYFEAH